MESPTTAPPPLVSAGDGGGRAAAGSGHGSGNEPVSVTKMVLMELVHQLAH